MEIQRGSGKKLKKKLLTPVCSLLHMNFPHPAPRGAISTLKYERDKVVMVALSS